MNKTDRLGALVGIAVAGLLTSYAYYFNSHRDAPRIDDLVYLVLFPPSIGLMATENASVLGQVFIIAVVVAANGGFYALVTAILRGLFGSGRSTR